MLCFVCDCVCVCALFCVCSLHAKYVPVVDQLVHKAREIEREREREIDIGNSGHHPAQLEQCKIYKGFSKGSGWEHGKILQERVMSVCIHIYIYTHIACLE